MKKNDEFIFNQQLQQNNIQFKSYLAFDQKILKKITRIFEMANVSQE